MRAAAVAFAFAALAAAKPQGVTSAIAPSSTPDAGCSPNYDGSFAIALVDVNTKRQLEKRQGAEGALGITLQGGILMDQDGRTGYVASNSQLQFDNPPQAGAIYTAGFTICQNGHLAIGNDEKWYKCLSGTFFNIYLDNVLNAGQCTEVYIDVTPLDGSSGIASSSSSGPSTKTAGQGTKTATPAVSSSSMAGNSTMIMSSSGAAGNGTMTTTHKTGTSTTRTGAGATTETSGTSTGGSTQQTSGGGSGSQGGSSSSTGAAGLPTARADMFGMAVGLLAMVAL